MTLREKIFAIQKLARAVPKKGYNEREDFYYTRIQDVVTTATRLMAKHELWISHTLKSFTRTPNERGGGSLVDVIVTWTLHDLKSNNLDSEIDAIMVDVPGSGWDYNSKATAKALTDSRKSAMILLFNLKGGDDPEERGPIAKDAAKDRQSQIADDKLANAAEGKSINEGVPALFYTTYKESGTVTISGDKKLMKDNADLLKEFKLGGKVVVDFKRWDGLQQKIEERGIPLKKLRAVD